MKKGLSLFVSLILCAVCLFSAQAISTESIMEKESEICSHLLTLPAPTVGSIGGEWMVLGLARSNRLPESFSESYYANVQSYVKAIGSAKLHRSKSTENARVILALTAIGKNPLNVDGYDLLHPLADFDFVKKQGVNGAIWTLLALDSFQYEIPIDLNVKHQTTREGLIDHILDNQCSDGGWDLNGESANPDLTGMAIQALAPYYSSDEKVRFAVDKALELISANQNNDGSFLSGGENTPESCAQIITALSALNIDCNSDSRFIKNNRSIADSLMSLLRAWKALSTSK